MSDPSEFLDSMLSGRTPEAEAAIVSYCAYLADHPLTEPTSRIYAKILHRNIAAAADALMARRTPLSLFSRLPAGKGLIAFALSTLSEYGPGELYAPIALSCLGVCQQCYGRESRGMDIYRLSVNDVYAVAKFLVLQNEEMENVIMDILEALRDLRDAPDIAQIAGRIMDHFLDAGKSLISVIPAVILGPDYSS